MKTKEYHTAKKSYLKRIQEDKEAEEMTEDAFFDGWRKRVTEYLDWYHKNREDNLYYVEYGIKNGILKND